MGLQVSHLFRCCIRPRPQSGSDPVLEAVVPDWKHILANPHFTKTHLISIRDSIKQVLSTLKQGTGQSSESSSVNDMPANATDLIQAAPHLLNAISVQSGQAQAVPPQIDQANDVKALRIFSNIMEGLGNLHWVACSLSLVGYVLKQMITRSANKIEAIEILDELVDLSSELVDKYEYFAPGNKTFKKAIGIIIDVAISCCDVHSGSVMGFLVADADANLLSDIRQKIESIKMDIISQCEGEILNRVPKPYQASEPGQSSRKGVGDNHVAAVMTLLSDRGSTPRALIIHGIGGIGKTTLLDKVCGRILENHPQRQSFKYANISLPLGDQKPITHWQEVLCEILTSKAQKFHDEKQGQSELLKQMKELEKPILLSIDNALEEEQLNRLLPEELDQLPSGSLILVTTRDLRVKNNLKDKGIQEVKEYSVEKLPEEDSRNLLEQKIGEHIMKQIAEEDLLSLLKGCDGHPLALTIAGKFIHHEVEDGVSLQEVCNYVLDSLKNYPKDEDKDEDENKPGRIGEKKIFKALAYSIDHLPDDSKTTFLDIVVFFNVSNQFTWDEVKDIYDPIPFKRLVDRSLINKRDNKVQVHDLLCSLAKHQMSKKGATRIKGWKELEPLLNHQDHIERIEGLDLSEESSVNIPADKLSQMKSLRLLFNSPSLQDDIHLQVGLQAFMGFKLLHLPFSNTDNLRSLYIYQSPEFDVTNLFSSRSKFSRLKHLLLSDCMTSSMKLPKMGIAEFKCLKTLKIAYCCRLQTLPEDLWSLTSLKELNLWGCESLEALPAIKGMGKSCCIETLAIKKCRGLKTLPEDLWSLTSLKELNLWGCESLEALPAIKGTGKSCCIQTLDIRWCRGLKTLPEDLWSLTSLKELNLWGCESLEALPAIKGMGKSCCIRTLDIRWCSGLKTLPEDICSLTSLKELNLWGCESLEALPAIKGMGKSCCIETLDIRWCRGLKTLPEDLWSLTSLKELKLCECQSLESVPAIEGMGKSCCIETLHIRWCGGLKTLPEDLWSLTSLKELNLSGCESLEALPAIEGMGKSCCIETLDIRRCTGLKSLPEDLCSLTSLKELRSSLHDDAKASIAV